MGGGRVRKSQREGGRERARGKRVKGKRYDDDAMT